MTPTSYNKAKRQEKGPLAPMVPLLFFLQEAGELVPLLERALRRDEEQLASRLKDALPDKWIKAPSQTLMFNINWRLYENEEDDHDGSHLKLDFKDDTVRLGSSYGSEPVRRKDFMDYSLQLQFRTPRLQRMRWRRMLRF